jgi:hypothetical protein
MSKGFLVSAVMDVTSLSIIACLSNSDPTIPVGPVMRRFIFANFHLKLGGFYFEL